jgi:hypothetical protein
MELVTVDQLLSDLARLWTGGRGSTGRPMGQTGGPRRGRLP